MHLVLIRRCESTRLGGYESLRTWSAMNLTMDETPSRCVSFTLQVEETTSDDEIVINDHCHGSCDSEMDRSNNHAERLVAA